MIDKKQILISLFASLILVNNVFPKDITSLNTVTVTAQKSEENEQKVPMSISVFNDICLADKSIENLDDIASFTPNLLLFNTGQGGLTAPSIRGISANILSYSSPVSLYIDGVATMNSFGFSDALLDIKRIEVLKGPQGTLYGKNSEVGVINIITKKPNNETRANVFAQFANKGKKSFGGTISGPIIKDKFYMAVSFKHDEKDGFIKNTLTNEYVNNKKSDYGKINLRFKPNDNIDISFIASRSENNNGAHDWASSKEGLAEVSSNLKGYSKPSTNNFSLIVDYNLSEDEKIKSITTKRRHKDKAAIDTDFSPLSKRHLFKDFDFRTLSQEFRYETKISNAKLVSGVYLDKEDNDIYIKIISPMDTTGARSKTKNLSSQSIGLFTNIIYPLNNNWTLNTGIRFDKEKKEMKIADSNINLNKSWSDISPKLSLEYSINKNSLSYVTISKGYRTGGFNPYAGDNKKFYNEESLISYELGYKSMFLNNRIKFNLSAYYMSISDMQVEETVIPGIVYMVNASSATSKGIELEFESLISDDITVFASAGFNDTSFDEFKDNQGDYKGNTNPYAPKYNYNLGTQYRNNAGFYSRIEVNAYGKTYFDKRNTNYQKAYTLVNTKIGYETNNYDLYLYTNNLFNKKHNAKGAYFMGTATVFKEQREIGAKLAYRF